MTLKEMQKRNLFKKVVTGIKAKKLCNLYDQLTENRLEIVKACAGKFDDLYQEVNTYATDNVEADSIDTEVANALVLIAEQENIWDEAIMPKLRQLEKGLQDFSFIPLLKEPEDMYGNTTELEEYENLVNSLLLFKKMRYENKLGNLEICVKNDVPLDETKLVNAPTAQVVV